MSTRKELFASADSIAGQKSHSMTQIRTLQTGEVERFQQVAALLHRVTDHSGLAHLLDAVQQFHQSLGELEGSSDQDQVRRRSGRVQRDFKAWLSAFRAFDDQTSSWISSTFGRTSVTYSNFKEFLSDEYDSNFAYRLSVTLRNASEHQGNVINRLLWTAREADGQHEYDLVLQLDGPKLCDDFPKLKATIKAELRGARAPLEAEAIVGAATIACERAHCGLMLMLWPELQSAIDFCSALHDEAVGHDGQYAILVDRAGFAQAGGRLTIDFNPMNLADLVLQNRPAAQEILSLPRVDIRLSDLS